MSKAQEAVKQILEEEGADIVGTIQDNLASTGTNASGETSKSLRYEVDFSESASLSIYGRGFIFGVETGRQPRKSSVQSGFLDGMLKWMKIRGIGSGLSQKKFEQLGRFFTWRQNKFGSKLFRKGGRKDIITPAITDEAVKRISDRAVKAYLDEVFNRNLNDKS